MDNKNDENGMGEIGPDQMEQTSPHQLSPGSASSTHMTVIAGNAKSPYLPTGNDNLPPGPSLGGGGESGSEEEQDLAVQVIDLEVLPSDSDDGVRRHIDEIGAKLNIKHVMGCLRLLADLLRIAANAVATDASQLVKVQELQFDVIKLNDAVSLMIQSDQSGANNILEKLKIAYLYLQDGFPDFAKTDIDVISKDVKSMEEATQKCIRNIRAAKSTEETVLKLVKSKKVERSRKVATLLEEIEDIKAKIGTGKIEPVLPTTGQEPLLDESKPHHAARWQMVYDIGINALLQMGCQAVREVTGHNSPIILFDVIGYQILINMLWTNKKDREDDVAHKTLKSLLLFIAPTVTVFAIASKADVRQVLQIGCGFGLPALSLSFKGVSPRPPAIHDISKESLKFIWRGVCAIGVVPVIGGCICQKRNIQIFALEKCLQILENKKTGLGPFTTGMWFFIISCIVNRRQLSVPRTVIKCLPGLDSASARPKDPPSVYELHELNEKLRDKREALVEAVDNVYISLLVIMVIEKSLPLLDDMTIVLDYATTLVSYEEEHKKKK